MTVIECFDKDSAIENIVSTLLCKPEKVVFIGSNSKSMLRSIDKYKAVADGRNIDVEFEVKTAARNNLMSIVGALEDVINNNSDCVIDLSGGDDLFLVAAGVLYAENADTLKLHRFSIENNKMIDCDSDGMLNASEPMEISVEENISVYGGRVVYTDEKIGGTYKWDFSRDFIDDIHEMWSVCKQNPSKWNSHIKFIDKMSRNSVSTEELDFSAAVADIGKEELRVFCETLKKLSSSGVIRNLGMSDCSLEFTFKNEQIKKCLTKSGLILELVITVAALEAENESGEPVYNDVATGVYIDWDGEIQSEYKADVENEMDVVLMKGMVPVFISCKNGMFSIDELYKISVVAERFGGRFVRKVLVATELEKLGSKEAYIRARAESMGIRIIDDADSITTEALRRKIKNLWYK